MRRAGEAATALGPIDVLVNNAGVMGTSRQVTADGLDLQLATNHFGPFLLTGLLLPQLLASKDATVVTVSSNMHRVARSAPLGDPRVHHGLYAKWRVYGQSKLANLLFTYELDRRARAKELPLRALAAHPGFAGTHLAANGQYGRSAGGIATILDASVKAVSQPAAQGAWPLLMAATADLPGATYVGPGGLGEMRGVPQVVTSTRLSRDGTPSGGCGRSARRRRGSAIPDRVSRRARQQRDHPLQHHPRRLVVGAELLLETRSSSQQVPEALAGEPLALRSCSGRSWPARRRVRRHLEDAEVDQVADHLAHRLPGDPGARARLAARSPSSPRIAKRKLWAGLMSGRPRSCALLTMCAWNALSALCTRAINGFRSGLALDIRKASLHYFGRLPYDIRSCHGPGLPATSRSTGSRVAGTEFPAISSVSP